MEYASLHVAQSVNGVRNSDFLYRANIRADFSFRYLTGRHHGKTALVYLCSMRDSLSISQPVVYSSLILMFHILVFRVLSTLGPVSYTGLFFHKGFESIRQHASRPPYAEPNTVYSPA